MVPLQVSLNPYLHYSLSLKPRQKKSLLFGESLAQGAPKQSIELKAIQDGALQKVYFEKDGEKITGLDLLTALIKAGEQFNNEQQEGMPKKNAFLKWLCQLLGIKEACFIREDNPRVPSSEIIKALPLSYTVRTDTEENTLKQAFSSGLHELKAAKILNYDYYQTERFWLTESGQEIARQLREMKGNSAVPEVFLKRIQSLKQQFESQVKGIARQLGKQTQELAKMADRLEFERKDLAALQAELEKQKAALSHLTQNTTPPGEAPVPEKDRSRRSLESRTQISILTSDVQNKENLIRVLEQQTRTLDALAERLHQEASEAIQAIKKAINRIDITQINVDILQMSGQPQEKERLNRELQCQLAEAETISETVRLALENTDTPEAFISAIQQIEPVSTRETSTVSDGLEPLPIAISSTLNLPKALSQNA